MSELVVAIGWFLAFAAAAAVVAGIILQLEPRAADKTGAAAPHH